MKCNVKGCNNYAGYYAYPVYNLQNPVCADHLGIEYQVCSWEELDGLLKGDGRGNPRKEVVCPE
jgi:hypothetical protein